LVYTTDMYMYVYLLRAPIYTYMCSC